MAEEKPKYGTVKCLKFIHRCAWERSKLTPVLCVLLAALTVGQSVMQLYLAPEILGRVESGAPMVELLGTIAFFTLGLVLFAAVLSYISNNAGWMRSNVRMGVMDRVSEKATTMSYPLTLDPQVKKLGDRAIETIGQNSASAEHIWLTIEELLRNIFGFAVYLLLMRSLDPVLLLVVTATAVASYFAALRAQKLNYVTRKRMEEQARRVWYTVGVANSMEHAKDIRIFGLVPWIKEVRDAAMRATDALIERMQKRVFLANLVDAVLSAARNGIAYFVLIRMALDGGLSAPEFLLYFTAVSGFTTWITGILDKLTTLRRECMDLSRTMEYLNLPEPFRMEGGRAIPERSGGTYELRLDHVSFRYPGGSEDTIKDVDLTIRPGEKLALVGLNGAGKSTIVKLLCGFLDPTEGRVLLGGVDIREFDRREYYKLISAVFQDFSVLDVTVAENVAQTAEDIDMARVRECIDKAGLTRTVERLPKGFDTHIGREVFLDGVELSGGETQRLMLARALYKDGAVLMLDEPTAALDPIAENDIYKKYSDMTAGKTSVFISHRLASTRFCDRIVFLAEGRIAEEGTHEELLRLGGGYAELFEVQSRYYREGRDF